MRKQLRFGSPCRCKPDFGVESDGQRTHWPSPSIPVSRGPEKLSPGELAMAQQQAEEELRHLLERERMPKDLLETMMSRASTQIYWVTRKDLLPPRCGYSSWFEELITARCDWDKDFEARCSKAPHPLRSENARG